MTYEIAVVLFLLAAAMVAFMLERLTVDVIALGLVVALVISGVLTPRQAFSGFANDVIIVLCSVFVLSGALVRSGIMESLGGAFHELAGRSESRVVASIMGVSAGMSAFISNTNSTAILTPAVLEFSRRSRLSPSRLLIPLAYASMFGGACTLIGTSTNLASSGLMQQMGMEPISMFELLPVGLTMVAVGVAYMTLVGHRLLPKRGAATLGEEFQIDGYLSKIVVGEDADLVGDRLRDTWLSERGISVLAIVRGEKKIFPRAKTRIEAGDALMVQASRQRLLDLDDLPGLGFDAVESLADEDLMDEDVKLAEAIVMPRSRVLGKTLRQLRLRQRYGISVLAVYRHGISHPTEIGDLPLTDGDVLLLQGNEEGFALLQSSESIWVIGGLARRPFRKRRGTIALVALIAAVAASALGILPVAIALLLAALTVVLTRCVGADEVYGMIEWRIIVLIGGMTSVGVAMQSSGAADYLAGLIVAAAEPFGLYAVLGAFVALTMVLTQPMSNAAAALVVLPVAMSTAGRVGVDPRPLAILVTLSASLSFIAPLEPACLLVYSPGRYRFSDFVKAGIPLTAIAFVIVLALVPIFWPLG